MLAAHRADNGGGQCTPEGGDPPSEIATCRDQPQLRRVHNLEQKKSRPRVSSRTEVFPIQKQALG
jgi:hypothetical protein